MSSNNNSFIKYYYLIGLNPLTILSHLEKKIIKKEEIYSNSTYYYPEIIDFYKSVNCFELDIPFYESLLLKYCFPNNILIQYSKYDLTLTPEFFHFSIPHYNNNQTRTYFSVLLFYENIKNIIEVNQNGVTLKKNRILIKSKENTYETTMKSKINPYIKENLSLSLKDIDNFNRYNVLLDIMNSIEFIYIPKVIVFATDDMFNLEIKSLLYDIYYRIYKSSSIFYYEQHILYLLNSICYPPKGKYTIKFEFLNREYEIQNIRYNDYPDINQDLNIVFKYFGVNDVLEVYKWILLEYNVFFFSSKISLVSQFTSSFMSFLYPFTYKKTYYPILYKLFYGLINNLNGAVVGINSSYYDNFFYDNHINLDSFNKSTIIVDIDKSNLLTHYRKGLNLVSLSLLSSSKLEDSQINNYNINIPDFPVRYKNKMINRLKDYVKKCIMNNYRSTKRTKIPIKTLSDYKDFLKEVTLKIHLEYNIEPNIPNIVSSALLKIIFSYFNASLIKNYKKFTSQTYEFIFPSRQSQSQGSNSINSTSNSVKQNKEMKTCYFNLLDKDLEFYFQTDEFILFNQNQYDSEGFYYLLANSNLFKNFLLENKIIHSKRQLLNNIIFDELLSIKDKKSLLSIQTETPFFECEKFDFSEVVTMKSMNLNVNSHDYLYLNHSHSLKDGYIIDYSNYHSYQEDKFNFNDNNNDNNSIIYEIIYYNIPNLSSYISSYISKEDNGETINYSYEIEEILNNVLLSKSYDNYIIRSTNQDNQVYTLALYYLVLMKVFISESKLNIKDNLIFYIINSYICYLPLFNSLNKLNHDSQYIVIDSMNISDMLYYIVYIHGKSDLLLQLYTSYNNNNLITDIYSMLLNDSLWRLNDYKGMSEVLALEKIKLLSINSKLNKRGLITDKNYDSYIKSIKPRHFHEVSYTYNYNQNQYHDSNSNINSNNTNNSPSFIRKKQSSKSKREENLYKNIKKLEEVNIYSNSNCTECEGQIELAEVCKTSEVISDQILWVKCNTCKNHTLPKVFISIKSMSNKENNKESIESSPIYSSRFVFDTVLKNFYKSKDFSLLEMKANTSIYLNCIWYFYLFNLPYYFLLSSSMTSMNGKDSSSIVNSHDVLYNEVNSFNNIRYNVLSLKIVSFSFSIENINNK